MTSREARRKFVENYASVARSVTTGTGIFPETLLAMAIIESSGRVGGIYVPGASVLSQRANNFFGIKAGGNWRGDVLEIKTKEFDKERGYYYESAKFRKYPSAQDGFKDYVSFLQKNQRYAKAGVFTAPDYVTQITRIAKAGYATAPNYADVVSAVANQVKTYLPALKDLGNALAIIAGALVTIISTTYGNEPK